MNANAVEERPVVLVVDDHQAVRELVVDTLETCAYNFQFLTAADGEKALKHAAETPVDLVITDLEMSDMNGDELIEKLAEKTPDLRVILMSGNHDKLDKVDKVALARGNRVRVVGKPFLPSQLRKIVDDLMFPKPAA